MAYSLILSGHLVCFSVSVCGSSKWDSNWRDCQCTAGTPNFFAATSTEGPRDPPGHAAADGLASGQGTTPRTLTEVTRDPGAAVWCLAFGAKLCAVWLVYARARISFYYRGGYCDSYIRCTSTQISM
jgi:hypothetical protein